MKLRTSDVLLSLLYLQYAAVALANDVRVENMESNLQHFLIAVFSLAILFSYSKNK